MTQGVPLAGISGVVEVDGDIPGRRDVDFAFWFSKDAGFEVARSVVKTLPVGGCLSFFDPEHPKISDQGAYVTYWRAKDGIQISWGNHGWTSLVVPVTDEEAANYLVRCMSTLRVGSDASVAYWNPVPRTIASSAYGLTGIDSSRGSRERNYLDRRLRSAGPVSLPTGQDDSQASRRGRTT